MSNVIHAHFGRKPEDGGKARIRRRREALGLDAAAIMNSLDAFRFADDLYVKQELIPTDSGMPSDSPYHSPAHDPA